MGLPCAQGHLGPIVYGVASALSYVATATGRAQRRSRASTSVVQLGREHNDICDRLRSEIDKARKEYDRRFRAIQDHPVDYFHRWMVEILAGGNIEAFGEY